MTSQKVTINLEAVDLGKIDFLVAHGFYSNRTDLIRHAIRNLLAEHSDFINQSLAQKQMGQGPSQADLEVSYTMGIIRLTKGRLEELASRGRRLRLTNVGMLFIDPTITPELADRTIESIKSYGSIKVSPGVREILGDRIK